MIVRAPRPQGGYTVLRNETLSDRRLSWAARGLLAYLLSKPDHWRVSPAHLVTETAEARVSSGRDAVYSLLGELETAGYIVRVQGRAEDGRMAEVERHIHETPQPSAPLPANPDTVQPHPVNPTLVSTDGKQELKPPTPPRVRAKVPTVAKSDSPVVIELPLIGGGTHAVTEADIERWAKLFPAVSVRAELANMRRWCDKNPSRLKTARGINKFIESWLEGEQNQPRGPRNAPNNPPRRHAAGTSAIERVLAANAAAGHRRDLLPDDDQPF